MPYCSNIKEVCIWPKTTMTIQIYVGIFKYKIMVNTNKYWNPKWLTNLNKPQNTDESS